MSAINDALGSIGDTAQSSSTDAADNAKAALDQVYTTTRRRSRVPLRAD